MLFRPVLSLLVLTSLVAGAENEHIDEGYIANGDHTLYFKTMGAGDPIVALHGGPGFDHRQFLPYIWDLARDHKVILYDQRCTGLSSGSADSEFVSIDTFIDDVEAVRTAFGIEQMNLLGHSWGGILAMFYGLRHHDRLKSLVLCSTTATADAFSEMRVNYEARRSSNDRAAMNRIAASDGYRSGDPATVEMFWRIYFKPYFADQTLVDGLDLAFTTNTITNMGAVASRVLASVGEFDLHEDLAALRIPVLVLHGDSDPLPIAHARRIHASIPGSELVVVPDAGHWLFVDGTDAFTRSILDFLQRTADQTEVNAQH